MTMLRALWLRGPVIGLLLLAWLAPLLSGCASRPRAPQALHLAALVVDGQRLARPGETGLAWVLRDGQRLEASSGMPLRPGDRLETGPSATAVVRWPGGSELLVRPGSSGRLGSFFDTVGEIFAKVRGKFAVETQFVRAGALGTQYLVRAKANGPTTVIVFEGRVEVGSTSGAWPSQVYGANTQVLAHPRPPQASPAPADELRRTREWVEQVERLVPPAPADGGGSTAQAIGLTALFVGMAALLASGRDKDPATTGQRGPVGTQGQDAQTQGVSQPTAPAVAPGNPRPGSANESSPMAMNCAGPLTLAWDAVAQAQGYQVVMDKRSTTGAWTSEFNRSVAASPTATAAALSGIYRWRVQARNAAGAGPWTAWMYLSCTPFKLG